MRARSSRLCLFVSVSVLSLGAVHCGPADGTGPASGVIPAVDEFAEPGGDAPAVGVARGAIIGGSLVPIPDRSGVVELLAADGSWFCSGVLLSNVHVLTAKHCIGATPPQTQGVWVFMGAQVGYLTNGIGHPTNDLYLARLNAPFIMKVNNQDSTTGYWRSVDTRNGVQLDGKTLVCAGYGRETTETTGPWGHQKQIDVKVYSAIGDNGKPYYADIIWVSKNSQLVVASGDSGGPCFSVEQIATIATAKLTSIAYAAHFWFENATAETLVNPSTYWIQLAELSMP